MERPEQNRAVIGKTHVGDLRDMLKKGLISPHRALREYGDDPDEVFAKMARGEITDHPLLGRFTFR